MSHRKNSRVRRGFSLSEMLTVIVILGILTGVIVAVVQPIISAPNKEQAKVDTVHAGARAMYRLQRDLRQSTPTGIFVCTYPAPSTCTSAPAALTPASVLAVITARVNGTGQVQYDPSSGQAKWQGYNVYWLVADAQGGTDLVYAFGSANGLGSGANAGIVAATATTAVNNALASASPLTITPGVTSLQTRVSVPTSTVGLLLTAQTAVGGHTNETSYESDTVARN